MEEIARTGALTSAVEVFTTVDAQPGSNTAAPRIMESESIRIVVYPILKSQASSIRRTVPENSGTVSGRRSAGLINR